MPKRQHRIQQPQKTVPTPTVMTAQIAPIALIVSIALTALTVPMKIVLAMNVPQIPDV
jgi:hypothetical protein